MHKPGRIIDSDDEEFSERSSQWLWARHRLAQEVQKMVSLLGNGMEVQNL